MLGRVRKQPKKPIRNSLLERRKVESERVRKTLSIRKPPISPLLQIEREIEKRKEDEATQNLRKIVDSNPETFQQNIENFKSSITKELEEKVVNYDNPLQPKPIQLEDYLFTLKNRAMDDIRNHEILQERDKREGTEGKEEERMENLREKLKNTLEQIEDWEKIKRGVTSSTSTERSLFWKKTGSPKLSPTFKVPQHNQSMLQFKYEISSFSTKASTTTMPPEFRNSDGPAFNLTFVVPCTIIIALVIFACILRFLGKYKRRRPIERFRRENKEFIPMNEPKPSLDPKLRIELGRKIGSGGFGNVWTAFSFKGKVAVAIKFVEIPANKETRVLREAEVMKCFDSPNLLKLYGYSTDETSTNFGTRLRLALEMELCQFSLKVWLERRTKRGIWDWNSKSMMLQITKGLSALHQAEIVHRDIKPDNILLGMDQVWKIGDFGLAKFLLPNEENTIGIGTTEYRCPKMNENTYSGDIFSLGLVFLEMRTPSFANYNTKAAIFSIIRLQGIRDVNVENDEYAGLIYSMLRLENGASLEEIEQFLENIVTNC